MAIIDVAIAGVAFRVHERENARYGAFWQEFASGRFEPATVGALCAHLGPGRTFFDGGAWIGPFTLLASALGADVVAVEADPVAVQELRDNLALNPHLAGRVELQPVAVAARAGQVHLDGGRFGLGNGLSRLTRTKPAAARGVEQSTATIAAVDVRGLALPRFTLVKLDIEGGEFAVLTRLNPSTMQPRPPLLLSWHGPDPAGCSALKRLGLRISAAPRQLRLVWALRSYRRVQRISSNRSAEMIELGRLQRLAQGLRLGETELLLTG